LLYVEKEYQSSSCLGLSNAVAVALPPDVDDEFDDEEEEAEVTVTEPGKEGRGLMGHCGQRRI
jgi:hypothetical protein